MRDIAGSVAFFFLSASLTFARSAPRARGVSMKGAQEKEWRSASAFIFSARPQASQNQHALEVLQHIKGDGPTRHKALTRRRPMPSE